MIFVIFAVDIVFLFGIDQADNEVIGHLLCDLGGKIIFSTDKI